MAAITINGHSIDPIENPTPGPPATDSQSNYILIQTNPSLTDERRAELADLGVTILQYLPRYSYLCRYEKSDLQPIRDLSYISWVEDYSTDLKVDKALTDGTDAALKKVDVIFHNDVDPAEFREALMTAAGNPDPDNIDLGRRKARLTINPEYLPAVAAIDGVRHIEEVRESKLLNNVAREILGLAAVNGNPGVPFEGEGQVVVVADSGFDIGNQNNVPRAFRDGDLGPSRVKKLYALGRPGNEALGTSGNSDDPLGHGTHVAGSIVGDGKSAAFGKVRGTAPKAQLIVQSLLNHQNKLEIPADLNDLFLRPYETDGARIHNNSWGNTVGDSTYTQQSYEVDEFVSNYPDFVVIFAAGNEGRDRAGTGQVDPSSITAPATAKNCITVGASESLRPNIDQPLINLAAFSLTYGQKFGTGVFPAIPINNYRMAQDPQRIAAISSRGPTKDNRHKPDLVAPGTFILSNRSRRLNPDQPVWAQGDIQFYFDGGTSMASPLVAGCVALTREFLSKIHNLDNPSAALVKALLINGAQPINGQSGNGTALPDSEQGFGRVNMATTVGPVSEQTRLIIKDEATALVDKQPEITRITIAPQTSSLKVTLVWTDPPGAHLQNDLDLIVRIAAGEERHGNQAPGSLGFDRRNNVEQVLWNDVPAGPIDIIVRAERIAAVERPQKYALVIRTIASTNSEFPQPAVDPNLIPNPEGENNAL